ncbi:YbaY family lipoprotein [Streptomyces sp. NRRL S-87]|uniref:YbaY family lipoprotein n=1 Tax=Streptomyces sp. NRRL S-87 TaxID=1463920 RepID=UPI0004BEE923|nr:YbaY family lipoprotein [Streptomyces sp. NRRL S-87]
MSDTVQGFVALPPDAPAQVAARLLVEVRDVSLADAASIVVGAQVQTDVPLSPGGRIPFRVLLPDLDPAASYGLRVHVDMAGAGTVEADDMINTRSVPVVPGAGQELLAPVTRV